MKIASSRNLPHATLPRLVGGIAYIVAASASAANVSVFTDRDHPVEATPGMQVVELDAPISLEVELSSRLPADPSQATAIARARLTTGGVSLQQKLAAAYQGVVYAWSLGIKKIPAVVVDRRYVVYGVPDVAQAVLVVDRYRSKHP